MQHRVVSNHMDVKKNKAEEQHPLSWPIELKNENKPHGGLSFG